MGLGYSGSSAFGMAVLCDFRWTKPPAPVTVGVGICEGTR